jgi:DNA-binding LytR/AlgR family response regulator
VALDRPHPDSQTDGNEGHIIIKADKKYHKVLFNDISNIESMDDFIRIHTTGHKFDFYERFVGMEKNYRRESSCGYTVAILSILIKYILS